MEIRIRQSGQVVTEQEFRALFPNTGFPVQLTEQIINDFGGDVVFEGPQPQPTRYQVAYRDGVQQIGGKWYTKYSVRDMTADEKAAVDNATRMSIVDSVQKRLDDFAKTRNYYNILSACTYATSTNTTFAAEAQYCVEKRDETWATVYQIEADVIAGKRPAPTSYADIEAELPALSWPATS